MKNQLLIIVSFFIGIVMTSGQTKKELKEAEKEKEYIEMKSIVDSKQFEFEAQWANPQQGGRINLVGNPNNVRIFGDSVYTYLPYFGVRTGGGGAYGGAEGGIKINNKLENYTVIFDDKKRRILIDFGARDAFEKIDFHISIYGGGSTTVNATSNTRSVINYDGKTGKFIEKVEEGD